MAGKDPALLAVDTPVVQPRQRLEIVELVAAHVDVGALRRPVTWAQVIFDVSDVSDDVAACEAAGAGEDAARAAPAEEPHVAGCHVEGVAAERGYETG